MPGISSAPRFDSLAPRSLVILRALQIGDMLCCVPAFRALRAAFPNAHIALAGLPWAAEFIRRFAGYLDAFIEFPGYPGLPEIPCASGKVPAFLHSVQRKRFDLALQLHGSGSFVNPLVQLFGARTTAGFFIEGDYCPDRRYFLPYPHHEHEIRRCLRLTGFLGIPPKGEHLEFPLGPADLREYEALRKAEGLVAGEYVCIHPGASIYSRRWPPERFAAVADILAAAGFRIAVTGAPAEHRLAETVRRLMSATSVNLAGRTSLGGLAAVISRSRLLIANDTAVSHLAAALNVPSVIIVTGSDPARWAPLDRTLHRAVHHPADCRPCSHRVCPRGHPCAAGVTPRMVIREADELLSKEAAHVA